MHPITEAAFLDELTKIAGKVDEQRLAQMRANLRPGDVINFQQNPADAMRKSVRGGLMNVGISQPIQKVTGSPEHHTAIFHGVDPESGKMRIVHNYEQGGKNGTQFAHLEDYADTTQFHAYRPHGATPEMGQAAATRAGELAQAPSRYSKRNLVGAGVNTLAEKPLVGKIPGARGMLRNVASRIGERCDPGTGICSALPVDAYAGAMGKAKALETMTGKPAAQVPNRIAQLASTPGTIRSSPHMQQVGHYAPAAAESSILKAGIKRVGEKAMAAPRQVIKRVASKLF